MADIIVAESSEKFEGYAGFLDKASKLMAIVSGLILTSMALMSIWSIIGRSLFGQPVIGDYELVQMLSAIAVGLALPYTHWVKANVIVDFFTMHSSVKVNSTLDGMANLLLAFFSLVICWRLGVGLLDLRASEDASMLLGIPTWWTYLALVPAFALLALTALYGLANNLGKLRA